MKKFLLIFAAVFFVLVLTTVIGGRILYQKFVESDDFREQLANELTRETQRFVANSVVDISSLKVTGLVDIETGSINVRSGERSEHVVTVRSMLIHPELSSLITFSAVQFNAELTMAPQGTINVNGRFSLSKVNTSGSDAKIEISGKIRDVNPVSMTDLMQTAQSDPFFRLTDAVMNGNFNLTERDVISSGQSKTTGNLNLEISQTKWMIASDKKRIVAIDRLPIALSLQDYQVNFDKPILLVDEAGTAELSGAILLPKRLDQEKSWKMEVKVNGSPSLLLIVSNLFKCQTPPEGHRFQVIGPFSSSRCPVIPAD